MTAAQLNNLYSWHIDYPDQVTLNRLLEGVRKYAIAKFYRDLDKEDIAQECVLKVWRSVDPSSISPLKSFDRSMSSFSTWVGITCKTVRSNYLRDKSQIEQTTDDATLDRLSNLDDWHSDGRRRVGPLPTEGYYYEKPDPKCKIPLGKSAWEDN